MFFEKDKSTWPEELILWPWLIFVSYLLLDRFFDGLQNTTRNIARIYLLKNGEDDSDGVESDKVQSIAFILEGMIYQAQEMAINLEGVK